MATTLKAQLALEGAGSYHSGIAKVTALNRAAEKSAKALGEATSSIGKKFNVKIALAGADRLAGRMKVLEKTTYTTSSAWQRLGVGAILTKGNLLSVAKAAGVAAAAFAALGVAAVGALAIALKKAAAEGGAFDAQLMALESSLARTGNTGAHEAAAAFAEYASSLQMTSRFTDDAIVKAGALGAALGIPHDRLQEVSLAAVNFATRTGKSLEESMTGIAKASQGQGRILSQSAIAFDAARLKAEGLDYVLTLLNGNFAGAAADSVKNYEGRLIVLGNAWGDVWKAGGQVLSQNPVINATIEETAKVFASLSTYLVANRAAISGWVDLFLEGALVVAKAAAWVFDKILLKWSQIGAIMNAVVAGLLSPLKAFTDSLAEILNALALVVAKLSGTRIGKSLGLTSGVAVGLGESAEQVKSLGNLQESFKETAKAHHEMVKKLISGESGLLSTVRDFERRVRASAKDMVFKPGVGSPIPPPGGGGGAGGTPEFLLNTPRVQDPAAKYAILDERRAAQHVADEAARRAREARNASFASTIAGSSGLAGSLATAGSPQQALATIITASEGFQKAIAPVNDMLQQFANIIGEPLAVVAPLLNHVAEALRPLLGAIQVMSGIITQINPFFLLLNVQLRLVAGAAKLISDAFIKGALGLLRAIKAILPKRLEPKWLDDSIKSLKRLRDASDTAAEAMETLGAILPEGYKLLELRRFNADPGTNFPNGGGGGGSGSGSSGGPGVAPPGWHYIYRNGQWILWPDGQAAPPDSSGNGATSNGATASGASIGGVSLAGAVIHVHGVQTESELFTKLRKIGQREATVRTGRYGGT